jgi:hypothetical protein
MKQAAKAGDKMALANDGKILLDGIGVPVNVPEAKRVLAAAMGVNAARVLLGDVWAEGRGGGARQTQATKVQRIVWQGFLKHKQSLLRQTYLCHRSERVLFAPDEVSHGQPWYSLVRQAR